MSKHTRLIVTVLFAVIIVLAVAITRFYVSPSHSTADTAGQVTIERYHAGQDADGCRIFEDKNGLCGIADSSGRITAAPEWTELSFAGNGLCVAAERINGQLMRGCIDYEGNTVIPFIYSAISQQEDGGTVYYTARAASDGSCVIYSSSFSPVFPCAWDTASSENGRLTVTDGADTFIFTPDKDGFTLSGATVSGDALGCQFTLDITDTSRLSGMSPVRLRRIVSSAEAWLELVYTGSDGFYQIVPASNWGGFKGLFSDDTKIVSRELLSISGISLRLTGSEGGAPCYELSFTTDTQITYTDSTGAQKVLRGAYPAKMTFRGSYDSSFEAVSGKFTVDKPEYPEAPAQPDSKEETH